MTLNPWLARLSILLISLHAFTVALSAQTVRLATSKDPQTGLPRLSIDGPAGASGALEVCSRLGGSWTALDTFALDGAPRVFLDRQAASQAPRFYRVKLQAANPVAPLPDLSTLPNQVFVPGEGFDTVQYAPNGTLGLLFWRNRDLVLRERVGASWSEQTIATDGSLFSAVSANQFVNFQPAAILLYDAASAPHVFRIGGSATVAHYTRSGSAWTRSENIAVGGSPNSLVKLVGAVGSNNAFHLGAVGSGGNIVHGTTKSGAWRWNVVARIGADPYWTPGSYARRWFSMAVDSRNAAHFVYRPAFTMDKPGGYPLAYSELAYATDKSGAWSSQIVRKPDDNSGEVGSGASIAIGPNDLPSIASWYNERGPGGSAQWSRLQFYAMQPNATWSRSEVLSRPDAYIAGDGEKGTGAQPHLRFDRLGRAHIVFLDHASEHFPYQNEYAGHVRHAWFNGSSWQVQSVLRQTRPLQEQALFPAFALSGSEMTVIALERLTQWNTAVNPQLAASTYKLRVVTKPLP